jgi:hypothetical protein
MKELNYTKQRVIQRLTERGFNYKQIEDWLNENFSYWNITGTEGSDLLEVKTEMEQHNKSLMTNNWEVK